jgi:hypothetical protein
VLFSITRKSLGIKVLGNKKVILKWSVACALGVFICIALNMTTPKIRVGPDTYMYCTLKWGCVNKATFVDDQGRPLFVFRYLWGQVPLHLIKRTPEVHPVERWLAPCPGTNGKYRIHAIRPNYGAEMFIDVREDCQSNQIVKYHLTARQSEITIPIDGKDYWLGLGEW